MAEERIPISDVKPGEQITFDSGYYVTGTFVRRVGDFSGKTMFEFRIEGEDRNRIFSYASHRSVRRG